MILIVFYQMQPLLSSPLLACEEDFSFWGDARLAELAREDVLCHFLAQKAKLGEVQHKTSGELAGVLNLNLHVMHSLGICK